MSFLDPSDPLDALEALAEPVGPRGSGTLSPRMRALLRSGNFKDGGYASRSELILALALAFVNAGYTENELLDALLDPQNGAGEKVRIRSLASAQAYVAACWDKARERAARRPAIRDRGAALGEIARIWAIVEAQPWKGRGGTSAYAVLRAHLQIAERTGKLTYSADVRTVSELAGLGLAAVSGAHRRLRHAGWLRLVSAARGREANVWALRCSPHTNTPISQASSSEANTHTSPRGGDERECSQGARALLDPGDDLWSWKGLGKAAFRVYQALHLTEEQSIYQLANALDIQAGMVRKHLSRLARHGLAVPGTRGLWRRGDVDPAVVADGLGVAGTRERRSWHHRVDRKRHRDYLEVRDRFRGAASLFPVLPSATPRASDFGRTEFRSEAQR